MMVGVVKKITLYDFALMPEDDARKVAAEFYQAAIHPTSEQLKEQKNNIDAKIKFFETQYKMSSEGMQHSLSSGTLPDKVDACSWLMLLKIRSRIEDKIGLSQTK